MPPWQFLTQLNATSFFTAGTFLVVLLALIKVWPVIALQVQRAKEKLREEGRTDLSDCQRRLDEMGDRLDGVYDVVNTLKIELTGVLSAYRVLEVAEEARDPSSIHLAQARAILTATFMIAPSTAGPIKKSKTLRSAEQTQRAADATVANVKRDERGAPTPEEGL